MINLRSKNGEHIVTHNGEKHSFDSLISAIVFIKNIMEVNKNV